MNSVGFVGFIIALCLAFASAGKSSSRPCHDKNAEREEACTDIIMPRGLCPACRLNEPLKNGHFKDCSNVYDIQPKCLDKLKEYTDLNPCDQRRKTVVDKLYHNPWDEESRMSVDYFLYAMCEQCCDLVIEDSRPGEYWERKENNKPLFSVKRGNGPAHMHYDVCKVLPDIESISLAEEGSDWRDLKKKKKRRRRRKKKKRKQGKKKDDSPSEDPEEPEEPEEPEDPEEPEVPEEPEIPEKPKVPRFPLCKMFNQWMKTPYSKNWLQNFDIHSSDEMDIVLESFWDALQCDSEVLWEDCVELEGKLERLGYDEF